MAANYAFSTGFARRAVYLKGTLCSCYHDLGANLNRRNLNRKNPGMERNGQTLTAFCPPDWLCRNEHPHCIRTSVLLDCLTQHLCVCVCPYICCLGMWLTCHVPSTLLFLACWLGQLLCCCYYHLPWNKLAAAQVEAWLERRTVCKMATCLSLLRESNSSHW